MKRAIVGVIAISLGLLLKSCDTTDPPDNKSLTLKLEDVSCTEAWIELTTTNLQLPATVTLKQTSSNGNTKSQILNLNTQDSLLYVDSLLPNKSYSFIASHSGLSGISSNELSVTTMDTTSHDFTFESWTFGTIGSSTLYDVAIINENNIWAVGEILVADTSINGYTTYNAVHWDGSQWELKRILYQGGFWVIRTIFAFSENDIWFSAFVRYDGQSFIELPIPPILIGWSMNKIWGSSSNDLYVVGNNGNIARYLNGRWSCIESGTDVNINDVFGIINTSNNKQKVFCAVSFVLQLGEHKILVIDENNNIDSLHWDTGRRVNSTWSNQGRIVYTSGGGIFNNKSGYWAEERSMPLYYTNRIRGNGLNDIFVAGDFGLLAHFNGMEWNIYNEFLFVASSLSISVNGNTIAAVGRQGEKALILVGKRN